MPSVRRAGILTIVTLATLVISCAGQKPALRVGSPIEVKKPAPLARITADPASFVGQTVRLEGKVRSVCKWSGCWVEVVSADGAAILARSVDHDILVPTDCEGRRIVVQGVMSAAPADGAAEGGHQHADGSEHHAGEEPHECPQPTYFVATSGIELY